MYKRFDFDFFNDFTDEIERMTEKIKKNILKNIPIGGDDSMRVNMYKKEIKDGGCEYVLFVQVPFIKKEDIEIYQVDENTIEISQNVKDDIFKEFKDNYELTYQEFVLGNRTFKRQFTIGNNPIKEIKQTMLDNGILMIKILTEKEQERKKKIILG